MKIKSNHAYILGVKVGNSEFETFEEFDEYDDSDRSSVVRNNGLDTYTINKHYDDNETD